MLIVLKELILSVMPRICDGFFSMFLGALWTSTGSVIRNVVSRGLRGSRGRWDLKWDKALMFHKRSIIQSSKANKTLQYLAFEI